MEYKPGKIRSIPRVYALLLVMLMILPVTSTKVQASDQILIGSAAEMKKIGKDEAYPLSGNYRLTADISMDEMIAGAFTGVFDGYGHTITLDISNTIWNTALFEQLANGTVQNLITKGSVTGTIGNTGAIIAYGTGTIKNCWNQASVEGANSEGTSGIAGFGSSTFIDCLNTGTITGKKRVGGITSSNADVRGSLTRCFSTTCADVKDGYYLIGGDSPKVQVSDCYYAGSVARKGSNKNAGTKLSGENITNTESYSRWDFTNTWFMTDEGPRLRMPVETPTFTLEEGEFTSAQSVGLVTTTTDATIYYTTNGNTPTAESTVYSGEIKVDSTTTIKAIAIKDGVTSDLASATYTIKDVLETAPKASAITYGQKLADSTLTGGVVKQGKNKVEGTFAWKNKDVKPAVSDSEKTEYDVVFTPADTDKHKTIECKVKLTVSKADITMTKAPAAREDLTSSGKAQVLISAGTASFGTVVYSLDGENFSGTLPEATDAGTYTVTYKVEGDDNHNAFAAQMLTVTIAANKNELNKAIDEAEDYYNSIKDSNPEAAATLLKAINAAKTVKDDGDATQEQVDAAVSALAAARTTVEQTVLQQTISQVMSEVSAKTGSDMNYTGNPIELINGPTTALPAGYTLKYAVTTENNAPTDESLYTKSIPAETDAGTYYLWYKVVDGDNHSDSKPECIVVEIAKKAATVTASAQTVKQDEGIDTALNQASLTGALKGHELAEITLTAEGTEEATTKGTITPSKAKIVDSKGRDVTKNYEIEYKTGALTVIGKISRTVTFKVVNGAWDDGTTKDVVKELAGFEGDTLKLTAKDIPAVGSRPAETFEGGSWDVTPKAGTEITKNVTYTYTYGKKKAVSARVIFKVVNGAWNDGMTTARSVTLRGYEGDELKLTADQIPAVGKKPAANYQAGAWDVTPDTKTVITGKTTYTYTYELSDEIFEPLMAKGEATGRKIRVTWNNIKGANRYVIYLASCNTRKNTYKLQKVKSVKAATGAKTMSWTSKKLKKGEDYKFRVKALRKISGKAKYETIGTSRVGHAIVGGENAKYTNPKSLKLSASKITLKKGEKATVTGKITGVNKKKTVLNHTAELRFTCYPNGVAKVNSKGVITAKKAGTTRVYVQTVNGIWKTVKVTVK